MTKESFREIERTDWSTYENGEHQVVDVSGKGLGIRHLQTAVMAVASFMAYSLRANLSVAIVAMVRYNSTENSTEPELAPTYDWGEETQGYLLSSFFWGYLITQIPAGIITERYGGHRFLCFSILGSSFLTLLMPQSAYIGGWFLACVNRMFQGVCQGFVYPSMFSLLGVWSPPLERGTLSSTSVSAQMLGTVLATPLSGVLSSTYGWPSVFYFFGAMGLATGLVMIFLGADSPAKHKMISEEEKTYIHTSLGGAKVKLTVPWKQVMLSAPFWAALIAASFESMVFLAFLTKLPTYLATVLKFEMKDNGPLSALPYLFCWVCSIIFSWSCDFLTTKGWMNLTTARKWFNSIAHFGTAIIMVMIAHAESRVMSVFLLTALMGAIAATFPGVQANFIDLAPNFSGAVYSVMNFSAACLAVTGPIIIGFVVTEAGSVAQWRIVFYLLASLLVLSNIVYLIWSTAETQWWNWPDRYKSKHDYKDSRKDNDRLQLKQQI